MKHILLISIFSLLNTLAIAQALQIRNSSNSQDESLDEPIQLTHDAPTNDIQAMVRNNGSSHTLVASKRGTMIIVEDQVLFIPPVGTNVGTNMTGVLKASATDEVDALLDTQLKADGVSKDNQTAGNAQNTEGPFSKLEALDNAYLNPQNAAHHRETYAYIRISPNPINDAAIVEIENAIHGTFQVFDTVGRLLNNGQFEGNQFVLERRNLGKGVYILRVLEGDNVVVTKKIVVN
jgi:hypothetical protein